MSLVNTFKKTFKIGDYSDENWATARQVYGVRVANELRNYDGTPTVLMTKREAKAYNILAMSNLIEQTELTRSELGVIFTR